MVTLVYIATTFVKPALVFICILSCTLTTLFILKPTKGANMKEFINIDERVARDLIRTFGKETARQILKNHGLTFADLGIK